MLSRCHSMDILPYQTILSKVFVLTLLVNRNSCIFITECKLFIFIYLFGYFYSASSSPLLLRGAPDYSNDTVSEINTPKRQRQLRVKDLPEVPTQRLGWVSNPRPSGHKAVNVPLRHRLLRVCLEAK